MLSGKDNLQFLFYTGCSFGMFLLKRVYQDEGLQWDWLVLFFYVEAVLNSGPLCHESRCCLDSCDWMIDIISGCFHGLTLQKLKFVDWKCLCTSEAPIEH